jgi:hypothetical protein
MWRTSSSYRFSCSVCYSSSFSFTFLLYSSSNSSSFCDKSSSYLPTTTDTFHLPNISSTPNVNPNRSSLVDAYKSS